MSREQHVEHIAERHRGSAPLRLAISYGSALGAVLAVTAGIGQVMARIHLANISMVYLVVVLAFGILFGKGPAVVASIAAFLAADYFFVQPIHTFTVSDPEEWIALLVLLVTAIVTGQLAARQRQRAQEAEDREREAVVLYEVGRALAESDLTRALPLVAEELREALGVTAAAIEVATMARSGPLRAEAGLPVALDAARRIERAPARVLHESALEQVNGPGGRSRWFKAIPPVRPGEKPPAEPWMLYMVPIQSAEAQIGRLVLVREPNAPVFRRSEDRALLAVANQLGQAIERAMLRQDAMEAEILQRTDELKTALLNAVSHELRTPLASIIASAGSLLQTDVSWTDEQRETFVEGIEQEAGRLNRIVGNLLDLSRIQGGSLRPQRGWYDLGALIDDVLGRLRPLTAEHHVNIALAADLPPVFIDYTEIDQLLSNLIENATRHTPPGTEILISAQHRDGEIRIEVADDGPGIAIGALPHLFEPFYRGGTAGTQPQGTGLGLAVAKGFAEAHGGRIWAENRPEGGARFVVTVPNPDPESGD